MRILAKLHIWLGWIVAIPLLLWTVSGIVMVAKPMAEVRGDTLRKNAEVRPIPAGWLAPQLIEGEDRPVELRTRIQGNSAVTSAIYADGKVERYFARSGQAVPQIDVAAARTIVAMEIEGGDRIDSVRFFEEDNPPSDLRRPIPVWQVVLTDGTHVYVGRDSGEIEAIRTRWWRMFDAMRTMHNMDFETRAGANNLMLMVFAALTLLMTAMGAVLLFRRKHAPVAPAPSAHAESAPE